MRVNYINTKTIFYLSILASKIKIFNLEDDHNTYKYTIMNILKSENFIFQGILVDLHIGICITKL